jgi:Fic family protein
LDALRVRLRHQVAEPRRWIGLLRRVSFARAIQGSNSIEGYNVSLDDSVAATEREEPLDATSETWAAVAGYREAMAYVLQLADDSHFEYSPTLLRSLHYMMLSYDLNKSPGRWRMGPMFVQRSENGEIVYEGPDAGEVPDLMTELVDSLRADEKTPAMIRAAMAHLNLAMVHPFRDGNGRMARCLQTLVLAREGIPRDWIRFSFTAHYHQAQTLLRRVAESEQRWTALETIVAERRLPERAISVLFNASMGFRIRNATYRPMADVSELVASRDLRALVDAGLLIAQGERRGRFYIRSQRLAEMDAKIRQRRPAKSREDPFELVAKATTRPATATRCKTLSERSRRRSQRATEPRPDVGR